MNSCEYSRIQVKEENSRINRNKKVFEDAIQAGTEDLMKEFRKVVNNDHLNISAFFELPDLINLFKTLNVQTGAVNLQYRGDGVQAKLIPEILNFIAVKESKMKPSKIKKGHKVKKFFIWGFEEPENSYEYKNAAFLAERFAKVYSKNAQIFITTHSKEFLSTRQTYTTAEKKVYGKALSKKAQEETLDKLKPSQTSSGIAIYRVWKNEETNNTSQVTRFIDENNAWDQLCDDLGIIQESRIIEELQENLAKQTQEIIHSKLTRERQSKVKQILISNMEKCLDDLNNANQIIEEYEKPVFYVEDTYDQIYKIAYLKIQGIACDETNFEALFKEFGSFVMRRGESAGKLSGRLRAPNTDGDEDKKIIGLFDFDKAGRENFYCLKRESFWENSIRGDINTGFFRKRSDHACFYAMLLPIPERLEHLASLDWPDFASYVDIESYLPPTFLKSENLVEEKSSPAGPYLKVKEKKKAKLWKKIFNLPQGRFSDFVPLFDKLNELFNS